MRTKAPSATKRQKAGVLFVGKLDMSSPATLRKFETASKAYTLKATKSKATALKTLENERILTKSVKSHATSKV